MTKAAGTFRTLSTRLIHEDRWMRLRIDEFERPSGAIGRYTVVEKPDFAVIAAIEDDAIHLVQQYRYPVGGRYWELPQGSVEGAGDIAPVDLARRELREETGLIAGSMRDLGFIYTAYGYSGQGAHVFVATNLSFAGQALEAEEEDLVTNRVPISRFKAMIRDGEIKDSTTLAAFGLLVLHALI